MSHKLHAQTVKTRVRQGVSEGFERSSFLDSVHTVETMKIESSEPVCESPLCDVRFSQTGLAISPKRFCCDECKQQASLIRRVAALLAGLEDSRVLEILGRSL